MTQADQGQTLLLGRGFKKQFKRRRCENCNVLYMPVREDQRFDKDSCRKEFHRYGSSYGPLKTGLRKAIEEKYAELTRHANARFNNLVMKLGVLTVEQTKLASQIDALRGQLERIKTGAMS